MSARCGKSGITEPTTITPRTITGGDVLVIEAAIGDEAREPLREIDRSLVAETFDRLSGARVERDHRCVAGDQNQPLVRAIAPVGDTAVHPPEARRRDAALVHAWVEHPFRFAGHGVDRRDLRKRSSRVEDPRSTQRRGLVQVSSVRGSNSPRAALRRAISSAMRFSVVLHCLR
jgi:hypothetical protein